MKMAFGSPGMCPKWTSGSKQGIGTAFNKHSHVWFTLSHGIISEIYYPTVDCPNTRDLQFRINPADPRGIDVLVDPNEAMLDLRNGSGCHPARNMMAGRQRWETELTDTGINCWFADLDAQTLPMGTQISFTFRWENRWEGKDFGITVGP